jgi:hypothetical protein
MEMNGKLEHMYISTLENKKQKKMKNRKFSYLTNSFILVLLFVGSVSCEREISDEVAFSTFPSTAEVFTDGFSAGLEYLPFEGSYYEAFTVDQVTKHMGSASMRFDVPNVGDPLGAYAGAIFRTETARDLSGYDALTFWAKGTQAGLINEIGFGQDFGESKFLVTTDLELTTNWKKYIIPIPDAYKLKAERGMFWYAEGPENDKGYSFWIDDLKFEKLGTIAQPRPSILDGEDKVVQSFIGDVSTINGLTQTFNIASGLNQVVTAAPSYFTFKSSNVEVARVSELGVISIVGAGTAKITAVLGGVKASGSLTIEAIDVFFGVAPEPTQAAVDVISLFSDKYSNVPVDFFNGYYGGSSTETADLNLGNDQFKYYTKLNYVGIEFTNPAVNASAMSFLHLDIWTNGSTAADFIIKIRDRGANSVINTNVNTGAPTEDDKEIVYTVAGSTITQGEWVSIDIPLTGNIANQKNNLAQIVFVGNIDFILDNLYFYK